MGTGEGASASRGTWVLTGAVLGVAISATAAWIKLRHMERTHRRGRSLGNGVYIHDDLRGIVDGFDGLIGNTPLVYLRSLSEATGCTILGKAEFLNPGGSTKDRVAQGILREAEIAGAIRAGGTVFEGTAGSTGISLSLLSRARRYNCHIVMPDDQAPEKAQLLEKFGATVERVRPVSIIDPNHFCNRAQTLARESTNGFYCDQFENLANYRAHYHTTGREVWEQTGGKLDAVVLAAGTGGTIAGVSVYVKERNPDVEVVLADPPGSSLYNKVKHGVMYAWEEAERKKKRNQNDTITEGIGINRQTAVFGEAVIDDAVRVEDQEAVEMAHYLLKNEGIFIGSSSAVNCVAAVRTARRLGAGKVIVTFLCDSGQRHLGKFWNSDYLAAEGLTAKAEGLEFLQSHKSRAPRWHVNAGT